LTFLVSEEKGILASRANEECLALMLQRCSNSFLETGWEERHPL
jgi:hypothetical protein